MKIVAIKDILETTENNMEHTETVYEVKLGETVEELMNRCKISGEVEWHYREVKVILKLIKEG